MALVRHGAPQFDLDHGGGQGSRVASFEAYESDEQFDAAAARLAETAAQEARDLIARLPSIEEAADLLLRRAGEATRCGSWSTYHAGVAAGLAGRVEEASAMFRAVTDLRVTDAAERCLHLVTNTGRFKALILSLIADQRQALGLSPKGIQPL